MDTSFLLGLFSILRLGCLASGCSWLRDKTSARCLLRLQMAARLTWYSLASADCFSPARSEAKCVDGRSRADISTSSGAIQFEQAPETAPPPATTSWGSCYPSLLSFRLIPVRIAAPVALKRSLWIGLELQSKASIVTWGRRYYHSKFLQNVEASSTRSRALGPGRAWTR